MTGPLAEQLQAHPSFQVHYRQACSLDLDDPAWKGRIAQMLVDMGGTVDPQFRGDVMVRDLLTMWAAQQDMREMIERRRDDIRNGRIDPKARCPLRIGGLDWG